MNTKIISKCLDELKKDSPDLSYIRGMLETLIEVDSPMAQYPESAGIYRSDMGDVGSAYRVPMTNTHGTGGMVSGGAYNPPEKLSSPESEAVDAALAMIGGIQPKPGVVTLERNVLLNG